MSARRQKSKVSRGMSGKRFRRNSQKRKLIANVHDLGANFKAKKRVSAVSRDENKKGKRERGGGGNNE